MLRWNLNAILLSSVYYHIIDSPTAMNLNYGYLSFGSTAGFCLHTQILSGVFLAMHYASDTHTLFLFGEAPTMYEDCTTDNIKLSSSALIRVI